MAYSDYGAFVYRNGERRTDKEDAPIFATDEETFGMDGTEIPSGAKIFVALCKKMADMKKDAGPLCNMISHGVMGDGDIRVSCYKCGRPDIYEATEDGIRTVEYCPENTNYFEYDRITFQYKGYSFVFDSGDRVYYASMTEPDGTEWECEYGYEYGAGFEDEDDSWG